MPLCRGVTFYRPSNGRMLITAPPVGAHMGALRFLFSSQGRINRAKLWLFAVAALIILALMAVARIGCPPAMPCSEMISALPVITLTFAPPAVLFWAAVAIKLVLLWAFVVLTVKRLHDRDKAAAWLWLFWALPMALLITTVVMGGEMKGETGPRTLWILVPSVAAAIVILWGFVEVYLQHGTIGDNRFGPDPVKHVSTREHFLPPVIDEAIPDVAEEVETTKSES